MKIKAFIVLLTVLIVIAMPFSAFAENAECSEHSFGEYVSDGNATCTADGTKTAICSVCGVRDTVTDVGSREGHAMGNGWGRDKFEHWKVCRDCGNKIEASFGEHTYALTHEREATRNSEGLDKYECTFCHYSYTETVPKIIGGMPTGAIIAIAICSTGVALVLLLLAFRKPKLKSRRSETKK